MKSDLFELAGSTALITGSSAGLGLTMARGLGEAGARLVLNGRNPDRLGNTVSEFRDNGFDAHGYAFDVADTAATKNAIESITNEVGPLNILINNAGINLRVPMHDMTDDVWQSVLDTNLTGAFKVAREVVRGMMERGGGKIINICSLMSEVHRPTVAAYSAAKGGLKMLTRAMAVEWAAHNIQANGIGPGYFETDMTRSLVDDPDFNAWICKRTPAGRWGKPEELVGAAVFLASKASSFVNGQIIYVDGGILSGL